MPHISKNKHKLMIFNLRYLQLKTIVELTDSKLTCTFFMFQDKQ